LAFLRVSALFYHIRSLRERGTATFWFVLPLATLRFALLLLPAAALEPHTFQKQTKTAPRFIKANKKTIHVFNKNKTKKRQSAIYL
jgi:hypothetical protein